MTKKNDDAIPNMDGALTLAQCWALEYRWDQMSMLQRVKVIRKIQGNAIRFAANGVTESGLSGRALEKELLKNAVDCEHGNGEFRLKPEDLP